MRKALLIISLAFVCNNFIFGQIASYQFENNLDDSAGNHDAEYLENGEISSNSPIYKEGSAGTEILLDLTQGVKFPSTLNEVFNVASSIEMSFQFRMEDLGENGGFMYLVSNQSGVNGKGWSIFSRHDIFSERPDYEVVFTYADGGFELGVPNHPGHNETFLGTFNEDDVVNIRLIMDFSNNKWSAIVNGNYTSAFFNDEYDIDLVKESFLNHDLFLGWSMFQEQDLEYDASGFAIAAGFHQVEFYSPKKAGDATILISALQAMTDHVNGITILSDTELERNLVTIQLNSEGNFEAAQDEIMDYILAYETLKPPLFEDKLIVNFSSLSTEAQVLIFLQQDIFDNQFVSGNIGNLAGVKFEAANVFPGKVSDTAPRLSNETVVVNGTYSSIQGARVAGDLNDAKRPTGYYLAPGDVATITVPIELIDSGLKVMVGAHDSDHSAVGVSNRFVRISKLYELNSAVTEIANPFGGGLYIKVPEGSDLGWFDIIINGAVKSPYFSTRMDRMSSPEEWQVELLKQHVPWVDIESDKFMTTLPLDHVTEMADPTLLLNHWDNIMDGYRYVGGRPYFRARAEYFLVDSRLPSGAYGTGYPQVVGQGDFELYPTNVLNPEFYKTGFAITLHEYGHLAAHPTLITEVESIVHLNASYVYNEYFDLPIDSSFKYSAFEKLNMDQAAMDWMIAFNFRNNNDMTCDPTMEPVVCHEVRYQHRGHAKYVNMAMLFGWEVVHGMNKPFYDRWTAEFDNNKVVIADEMIQYASESAGLNMAPLMHFWGLQPSDELAKELADMPKSNAILETLIHYKSLIPEHGEAFRNWYDILRPKKGEPHFNRYDRSLAEFDSENYAEAMRTQIDFLIATYFPPANTEVEVLNFNLSSQIGETIVDSTDNTIAINVENATDLTALAPMFSLSSGATATINGVVQESGITTNDFTNPVTYTITAEDNITVQDWVVTITAETSSSVNHLLDKQLLFYPNPVEDELQVTMQGIHDESVLLVVYDLFGRQISWLEMTWNSTMTINTSAFESGIYFGVIQSASQEMPFKFVKK